MPTNFVPSISTDSWTKDPVNHPSHVFKAHIDPKTMLWKDVRGIKSEEMSKNKDNISKGFLPDLKPIETQIGGMITVKGATGVPLPQLGAGKQSFKDEHIVKRGLRVILETKEAGQKHFIGNILQVPAQWNKANEDVWDFDESSLRQVLLRSIEKDKLVK